MRLARSKLQPNSHGSMPSCPVAAEVGDVAVLLGSDEELELVATSIRRLRSGVSGAIADAVGAGGAAPERRVVGDRRSRRARPATGAPLSRRVTNTSVFCGLSFTVMPRFVTWTTVAGRGWSAVDAGAARSARLPRRRPRRDPCPPVPARLRGPGRATAIAIGRRRQASDRSGAPGGGIAKLPAAALRIVGISCVGRDRRRPLRRRP